MAFRDFRETGPTVVARISLSSKKFISGAFAQAQAEQTKSAILSFICFKSKGLNFLFLDLD